MIFKASTTVGAESGWLQLEPDTEVETGDLVDVNAYRSPPDPYNVVNTVVRKAHSVSTRQNGTFACFLGTLLVL